MSFYPNLFDIKYRVESAVTIGLRLAFIIDDIWLWKRALIDSEKFLCTVVGVGYFSLSDKRM